MHRYIHSFNHNNEIAVLVEFRALDDYTVRTPDFQQLAVDICLHIAASDLAAAADGPRILPLLNQQFVKDDTLSVRDLIETYNSKLKGRLSVLRYVRFRTNDPVARTEI